MKQKMEATTMGYIGYILGSYRGNGREHGSYDARFRGSALGLRDIITVMEKSPGKEHRTLN